MPGIPVAVRHAMWALDGRRVALRRPRPADEHAYAATMDDDFRRINGWDTGLVDRSLQLIRSPRAISLLAWALIWSRETGSVVGSISADQVNAAGRTCQLGWWLGPEHRGRGYGTEAVRLALGALHAAGVERIRIGTALDNVAVRRVAAKVGAAEESQTGHRLPDGRWVDAIWYVHTSSAAPQGVVCDSGPVGRQDQGDANATRLSDRRPQETTMADKKLDKVKGRAKEAAGDLTGDRDLEREGKVDRASGGIKDKLDDVTDKVKDVIRRDR